jgi:hypothetical protein
LKSLVERVFHVGIAVLAVVPVAAGASVSMDLTSVAPARPHFVRPGTETTFVIRVRNASFRSRSYSLAIELQSGKAGGWIAGLSPADELFRPIGAGEPSLALSIPPRKEVHVLARIAADSGLAEAEEGLFVIHGSAAGLSPQSLTVAARARNQPKVYYVAIDAAGRDYVRSGRQLVRRLERKPCPVLGFLATPRFSRASGHLPATTTAIHCRASASAGLSASSPSRTTISA